MECSAGTIPNIELDLYQSMPNHFHGIIAIVGASLVDASSVVVAQINNPTLGAIVGAFKSITTNEYIKGVKNKNWPRFYKRLWPRNYFEHIIRDEADLNRIRHYIQWNPTNWDEDKENPKFIKP